MVSEISDYGLTVAIVTKNEQAVIMDCLNSIIKQTVNIERILLIDSSTDKTVELAEKIGDQRLEIIHGEFNVGMARHLALQETKTRLLFFVDADCVLEGDTMERLIRSMDINDATMVSPQVLNPLSAFPEAWHAGQRFVSFLPFTAVLIKTEKAKNISNKYMFMSCAEDAFICREILSSGGRLFIDNEVKVNHNYPIDIKRLLKKGYWYGTGDAILFHSRKKESFPKRISILFRSAAFFLFLFLLVIGLLINNVILFSASLIAYIALIDIIYIKKFGILPGLYRSAIELIRSPAWSFGTIMTFLRHKFPDYYGQ